MPVYSCMMFHEVNVLKCFVVTILFFDGNLTVWFAKLAANLKKINA